MPSQIIEPFLDQQKTESDLKLLLDARMVQIQTGQPVFL